MWKGVLRKRSVPGSKVPTGADFSRFQLESRTKCGHRSIGGGEGTKKEIAIQRAGFSGGAPRKSAAISYILHDRRSTTHCSAGMINKHTLSCSHAMERRVMRQVSWRKSHLDKSQKCSALLGNTSGWKQFESVDHFSISDSKRSTNILMKQVITSCLYKMKKGHCHNTGDTEAKLNWESIRLLEVESPEWND